MSERTLHSLKLSYDEPETSSSGPAPNCSPEGLANGGARVALELQEQGATSVDLEDGEEASGLTPKKKPSYLGLACSVSGYSGITRYDSKLREGFRSRDSSPGTRLVGRDPVGSMENSRSTENLDSLPLPRSSKSQAISPLAMDHRNGFDAHEKQELGRRIDGDNSMDDLRRGYCEVDRGLSSYQTFSEVSPIRGSSPQSRNASEDATCEQRRAGFLSSSVSMSTPRPFRANASDVSFGESSMLNGSTTEISHQVVNTSEKSFIQQRVERLYGPGALAQGFFFKRSPSRSTMNERSMDKSSGSCVNISISRTRVEDSHESEDITNGVSDQSLKSLPVLRHLRPEFRAQLPVINTRRISQCSPRINLEDKDSRSSVAGEKSREPEKIEIRKVETVSSMTIVPDHQPAAPEVVLPVAVSGKNSASILAHPEEAPASVQGLITTAATITQEAATTEATKDGHYYIKLLKEQTSRLLSLASKAEAELADSDPAVLPEEAAGKLRCAAGKARLLASQKMQQFEGLCQKNINQVPGEEFPTTNEDLAGFWDMVMLQVVQVNQLFEQIETLRSRQWQEVGLAEGEVTPSSAQNGHATKRRTTSSRSVKPRQVANTEASRKAREAREQARRQMIEERRRAIKSSAPKDPEASVAIFAPKT
ncbi:uncharacterized protein LOC105702525 isoform X2 [Orussus abietinus]|nr:uncharacterized protein LOC105702525 isoform X2 [Orussus abietinus]